MKNEQWCTLIEYLNRNYLRRESFKKRHIRYKGLQKTNLNNYINRLVDLGYITKIRRATYKMNQKIPNDLKYSALHKFHNQSEKKDQSPQKPRRRQRNGAIYNRKRQGSYAEKCRKIPVYTLDILDAETARLRVLLDPRYGDIKMKFQKMIDEIENCRLLILKYYT